MLVMVEMADQTALWWARGQRMMATLVRMFIYFTAKERNPQVQKNIISRADIHEVLACKTTQRGFPIPLRDCFTHARP